MMATPPYSATPKRKRDEDSYLTPIKFSFDLSRALSPEDGSNSPSSKVAHKFCGLVLEGGEGEGEGEGESGGGAVTADDVDMPDAMRKRRRPDVPLQDGAESVDSTKAAQVPSHLPQPQLQVAIHAPEQLSGALNRSYPSINRLSNSKSRVRKRSGTPPLRFKRSPVPNEKYGDDESTTDEEIEIIDPLRASLTWHEDEITVYDPEDEDDDGTGINGVGFKPTPALAQARSMKRRQQMAEYRKREENEGRAKRSQRRRERNAAAMVIGPDETSTRKVRFMDADHQNVTVTMG
ncbi:hypothetical protein B0I35DRAFT_188559 [Stachybotrys elegans]|uniref:Uncharacterized protein n=1 Tax=Stachybotrys elegans TaxID=80388 RepID=A0A8K0SXC0_9HYPO|nr:hypothetical protein B0I35DRAFT_188559 [Stachybotrys elegans]